MGQLLKSLREYADSDHLPMHMPGHKRCMGEIGNPYFIDITEIDGFDDLHHAEGILADAQKRAADLYHAEETHYLVNGSTAGVLAAVSGCTTFGGKLLMARNCHRSAYHAAFLKGLHVEYLYPQSMGSMGINGKILPKDVDNMLQSSPDTEAVLLTSPTYDGIVSDIRQIADCVHGYWIPLIVDEAHGAHFPFSAQFPEDCVSCGADVVIHSLHKTLPALTQTGLIHLNGTLADRERIRKYLTVYQTSSPSYVLMAGLDSCVEWIRTHPEAFDRYVKDLGQLREELRRLKYLELLEVPGMDETKILISLRKTKWNGQKLAEVLRQEFRIEPEMACSTYVCMITTVADTKESLERLKEALCRIDGRFTGEESAGRREAEKLHSDEVLRTESVCTFQEAEESEKEWIYIADSCGRISGDFVTVYPPGIPLLAPGELITAEVIDRLCQYEKDRLEIHGIRDGSIKTVREDGKISGRRGNCI